MAAGTTRSLLLRLLFGPVGRLLPFGACRAIARPLARTAWALGLRRRTSLRNLEMAFPDLAPAERFRIGRESHVNLFTVFLEILTLRYLTDRELRRWIEIENVELLEQGGDGAGLLLSAHVGNWELLAFGAAAISGVPFAVIVKQQSDDREMVRTRTARGNSVIPTARAAREAALLLRNGGTVAMLADQSATDRDHLVNLFGIPTWTYSAPSRLALRFRPHVVVGYAVRRADGGYRVKLREIPHDDLEDTAEGAVEFTRRYSSTLESVVRLHPEQWVWQHKRWKNTPGVRYE